MTFLWILLAIDVFVALYWMNFMWSNQKCREAIFKFRDDRDALNKPLPGMFENLTAERLQREKSLFFFKKAMFKL